MLPDASGGGSTLQYGILQEFGLQEPGAECRTLVNCFLCQFLGLLCQTEPVEPGQGRCGEFLW